MVVSSYGRISSPNGAGSLNNSDFRCGINGHGRGFGERIAVFDMAGHATWGEMFGDESLSKLEGVKIKSVTGPKPPARSEVVIVAGQSLTDWARKNSNITFLVINRDGRNRHATSISCARMHDP